MRSAHLVKIFGFERLYCELLPKWVLNVVVNGKKKKSILQKQCLVRDLWRKLLKPFLFRPSIRLPFSHSFCGCFHRIYFLYEKEKLTRRVQNTFAKKWEILLWKILHSITSHFKHLLHRFLHFRSIIIIIIRNKKWGEEEKFSKSSRGFH